MSESDSNRKRVIAAGATVVVGVLAAVWLSRPAGPPAEAEPGQAQFVAYRGETETRRGTVTLPETLEVPSGARLEVSAGGAMIRLAAGGRARLEHARPLRLRPEAGEFTVEASEPVAVELGAQFLTLEPGARIRVDVAGGQVHRVFGGVTRDGADPGPSWSL